VADEGPDAVTTVELDLATEGLRELYPPIHDVEGWIRLSKDGRKMLFYRGNRNLREMKLVLADLSRGGEELVLADEAEMEDGRLARWVRPQLSPDGSQVLFGTQSHHEGRDSRFRLWLTPADGSGGAHRIAAAEFIGFAAWHPDGTHIVHNTWEGNLETGSGGIFVLDVRTGEQHEIELPPGTDGMQVYCWSSDGRWIGLRDDSGSYELRVVENVLAEGVGGD
jgi:Tol biopolymer transport system component